MPNRLFILLVLASLSAHADIIDHGWYSEDTDTGLYWLDFTESQGLTYTEVQAQFGPGQRFEGWRYANGTEAGVLLGNFGIPAQGNACLTGYAYCDAVLPQYAETVETIIRMLGDTQDAFLDSYNANEDVSPDGAGAADAYIERDPPCPTCTTALQFRIRDLEYVLRGYGSPLSDGVDDLRTGGQAWGKDSYYMKQPNGHALVRADKPAARPVIPGEIAGAIDYETLEPADLGFEFLCTDGQVSPTLSICDGHFLPDGLQYAGNYMRLGLSASYDRLNSPALRVAGFDYRGLTNNSSVANCSVLDQMYVDIGAGRVYPQTVGPAPQGGAWCRATFDTEMVWLPDLPDDPAVPGFAPVLTVGTERTYTLFWGWSFDNWVIETVEQNVETDFDPWSTANEVRPNSSYLITMEIKTTSLADGDAYDFDAAEVDPSTLALGSGFAAVAAAPITADYDGDGDTDYIFGFQMQDTGIDCLDTSVTIIGQTYAGEPFVGQDVIVPVECEQIIEMDIEPWDVGNEVQPDNDYVVTVGIMTTSVADGDASNFDALTINPATLRFGPAQAANVLAGLAGDLDGDTYTDVVYGFNMSESGIACGDTELELIGETYSGLPVIGSDSITTTECTTSSCHP